MIINQNVNRKSCCEETLIDLAALRYHLSKGKSVLLFDLFHLFHDLNRGDLRYTTILNQKRDFKKWQNQMLITGLESIHCIKSEFDFFHISQAAASSRLHLLAFQINSLPLYVLLLFANC